MVKKAVFSLVLCLAIVGCVGSQAHLSGLKGQAVPPVRFTDFSGTYRSLREFGEKPVVVLFWAEWCMFSKPVIAELNELASRVPSGQAIFLAVSIDPASSFDKLRYRIDNQGLHSLHHAFSGNELHDEAYQILRGQELPHVYVIDSNGVVIEEGHDSDVAVAGLRRAQVDF